MLVTITYTLLTNIVAKDENERHVRHEDKLIDENLKEISEMEDSKVEAFISDGSFKLLSKWKKEDWDALQIRNVIVEKELYEETIKTLSEKAVNLSDEKQLKAEFIIAEKTVTQGQRERYMVNYKHARIVLVLNQAEVDQKASELGLTSDQIVQRSKDTLAPIAASRNMTVEDLSLSIVETAKSWEAAVDIFSTLIEAVRIRAFDLIKAKKFNSVHKLLDDAENIGVGSEEMTPEETLGLVSTQVTNILTTYTV